MHLFFSISSRVGLGIASKRNSVAACNRLWISYLWVFAFNHSQKAGIRAQGHEITLPVPLFQKWQLYLVTVAERSHYRELDPEWQPAHKEGQDQNWHLKMYGRVKIPKGRS